jgi:hypothetical protein
MPPGVPRDRVRAVEAAFLKTLKDPEFVAEAEKTRMTLNAIPRATLHNMIIEGLSMIRGYVAGKSKSRYLYDLFHTVDTFPAGRYSSRQRKRLFKFPVQVGAAALWLCPRNLLRTNKQIVVREGVPLW